MPFFSDILGITAANAARQSARVQTAALGKSKKEIRKGTEQSIGYLKPYAQTGQGANNLLANALGINGPEAQSAYYQNFQTDPGYMATQNAGIGAINQNRATSGLLNSGGSLKAIQDFSQRLMQSQFQDRLQRLAGQQEQGRLSAGQQGQFQMTGSQNIADILGQIGGAQASGIVGAANARTAGSTGLLNAGIGLLSGGLNAYFGRGGGYSGGGATSSYQPLPWRTSISG